MSDLVQTRWDVKLTNWALWLSGSGLASNASPFPAYRDYVPSRRWWLYSQMPQPLIGAAVDTDKLVVQLVEEQRRALLAWYVWTGGQQERADRLRVPYTTWRERVIAARFRLEELDILRRAATVAPPRHLAFAV